MRCPLSCVPYFSGYKPVFFSFKSNKKNLDPDLDLWGLFKKGKTRRKEESHRTDLVIYSHREEKPSLIAKLIWYKW